MRLRKNYPPGSPLSSNLSIFLRYKKYLKWGSHLSEEEGDGKPVDIQIRDLTRAFTVAWTEKTRRFIII